MRADKIDADAGVGGIIVFLVIIVLLFLLVKNNPNNFDGKYCTIVTIENVVNPGDYNLTVDITDNRLFKIYFPNEGWLDETHFVPKKVIVESNGYCSLKDDRGRDISFFLSQDEKGSCNK